MKSALAIAALMSAALAAPAFAQSPTTGTKPATTFYIVQDATTKRCTVMQQRPTATTMTIVGGDTMAYKTETEAQTALKTTKACTN